MKFDLSGIRPDKMTSAERMSALMQGKPIDRVPFIPFIFGFTALNVGYSLEEFWSDGKKMFEAQVRTQQMFDYDSGPMFTYPEYGAWEFGGSIKFPTGEYEQAPMTVRRPVESEEEGWNLKVPDVETAGSIPIGIEFSKMQKEYGFPIIPPGTGPFNLAGKICGADRWCRWLVEKPDLCHHILQLSVEHRIQVVQYWIDTFGSDNVTVRSGAFLESNQLISPKLFEDFALPYTRGMHKKILAMPVKKCIIIHICGEHNRHLPYWAQIDFGNPGMCSFGHEVSIATAIKYMGDKNIIMGNVDQKIIQSGRPEEVYEECRKCIEEGKKTPRGFVLMSGCEVPAKTPPYNIWIMRKAVSDFGWYD
jgi:uroporphyrinogen decarboxylase